jgi:MFS family permease
VAGLLSGVISDRIGRRYLTMFLLISAGRLILLIPKERI